MTSSKGWASRLTRDTAIVASALGWAWYEIVLGGGRASVLTFIGGIVLALLGVRLDAVRKNNGNHRRPEDHDQVSR
jgi:hypothetical protein